LSCALIADAVASLISSWRRALRRAIALQLRSSAAVALPNDTRTRLFAAVRLEQGGGGAFDALVDAVDGVVTRYGGERFHAERLPHFSAGWSPPPPRAAWAGRGRAPAAHAMRLDRAACRIGERSTEFRLAHPRDH